MLVNFIRSVGDQAAIGGPTGSGIDGWLVPGRERDDQIPTTECRRARGNNAETQSNRIYRGTSKGYLSRGFGSSSPTCPARQSVSDALIASVPSLQQTKSGLRPASQSRKPAHEGLSR
jgi:hypothetical protein